ncbi:MAG: hypothetical protein GY777_09710, partial [Candidatus Brocadiaceae bacterium]|nr:hypothetical protein [Candidatus Brocadiaceae bacterium]
DIFDETSDLTINGMVGLLDSASIGNNDSVFRIAKEYDDKTNEDGDDQDLVSSIERSRNYIESLQNDENIVSRSIVGATLSLTAGIAVWLVRGGSIFASFFMSMPLWKRFDPLPLLSLSRKKRREKIKELRKIKEEESKDNKAAADLLDTKQKQKAEKEKNRGN